MKTRFSLLLSGMLICQSVLGQTNVPAPAPEAAPAAVAPAYDPTASTNAAAPAPDATAQAPAAVAPEASAQVTDTNSPAASTDAPVAESAVATDAQAAPEPQSSTETNAGPSIAETAATAEAAPAAPDAAGTNVVEQTIPLVEVEASLPDAVQLLARQAGINFQFDPKLLSQTGPNGQPIPPPSVKIRWENVTAMQALNALLDNYGWQLVQDPKSRIGRVIQRDPKALDPLVTKVIQLKYSNPTNIIEGLKKTLSDRSQLIPDIRTSQLIVMTTEKELPGVENLLDKLDRPTRQVLIEGKIVETTKNPKTIKGIDWTDTLQGQNVTFGNGITTGTTTTTRQRTDAATEFTPNGGPNSVSSSSTQQKTTLNTDIGNGGLSLDTMRGFNPSTAFLNADGVHAVLSFLNSDAETESVALPRTVALDGFPTELSVIRNVPIFEQQQTAGAVGGQALATVKPNYSLAVKETIINEVGVKLNVTPRIVGLTNVFLDLKPEISAQEVQPAQFVLNGERNEAPIFSRRKIVTQATVPSGYTLVLGGLKNDNTQVSYKKVPFFGDLPGIGLAFRHDTKERTRQNLLIFVTPTIIAESDFQATKTDFLKTKFVPKPDVEDSPWDTGKPKDWTKPKSKVEPVYQPKSAE